MTNFILNNTEYRFITSSGRYSKTTENGKTTRIGKTEWELAVEEFEAKEKAAQQEFDGNHHEFPNLSLESDEFEQFEAEADFADIEAMLNEEEPLPGTTEEVRVNDEVVMDNHFIKVIAPKKARRPKDIGYENKALQVTLTAKQTDFIRRLPNSCFYEDGLNSALWVDCLSDDLGGQFANKPMTVGAMVSTLNEKNLISVGKERREGRKVAFFTFTPMGQKVAKELGLK